MTGARGPRNTACCWTRAGDAAIPALHASMPHTFGIVYEGSQADLVFEKIALKELLAR
jgi:hypothetical protein